jgi:hypothetical protein
MKAKKITKTVCIECGEKFDAKVNNALFCSRSCRQKDYRKRVEDEKKELKKKVKLLEAQVKALSIKQKVNIWTK